MTTIEMIQVMAVATVLLIGAGIAFTGLRWVWHRSDRSIGPGDLADLQARVAELEAERGRVAELEERVDFAERMLAQAKTEGALPRGEAQ
jgi:hypothetical protein